MAVAATVAPASLDADTRLMLSVRDGDAASFGRLVERHRTLIVHYLYRMVQNQAIAEELAQEVFLRIYRSRLSYEPSAKFTTWLFRIATNLAFNSIRDDKSRTRQDSLDDEASVSRVKYLRDGQPSVESVLVHQVKLDEVRDAISKLPAKQRAAVLMHKYEEMEYSQIARVLECSESAVKSLLFRAYESLRVRLVQYA